MNRIEAGEDDKGAMTLFQPSEDQRRLIVIVTGLSGAGKTVVLRAFEDLGFYCMDNIPLDLVLLAGLSLQKEGEGRIALGIDIREKDYLAHFEKMAQGLRHAGFAVDIIFLDARSDVLARRFKETRRPHPLQAGQELLRDSLRKERAAMSPLLAQADRVIDTSSLSPHQLRDLIHKNYATGTDALAMRVNLTSFGFKYGPPSEADLVLDVRFLPNPHFVPELREKTGLEPVVSEYVFAGDEALEFLDRVKSFLDYLLPKYQKEGKAILNVAIGCTGGRHRSPAIVVALAEALRSSWTDTAVSVHHRELEAA